MNIYQENILDHYHHPRNHGKIKGSVVITRDNPSCGDVISLSILLEAGVVHDAKFEGSGCAISQAAASMLTEEIIGKTKEDVQKMSKNDILELLGIEISLGRLKCALLALETVHEALAEERS